MCSPFIVAVFVSSIRDPLKQIYDLGVHKVEKFDKNCVTLKHCYQTKRR